MDTLFGDLPIIVQIGLIVGSSSVVTVLVTHFLNRKRNRLQTAKLNVEIDHLAILNYKTIVDDLQSEVKRWKGEVRDMKERMDRYSKREELLMDKINILERENVNLREEVNKIKRNA